MLIEEGASLSAEAMLTEALKADLDSYSVEDLEDRIAALKAEIARCESLMAKQSDLRAAAESFFKS